MGIPVYILNKDWSTKNMLIISMIYLKTFVPLNQKYQMEKQMLELGKFILELDFKPIVYLVLIYITSYFILKKKKLIPLTIEQLLTPQGLAYWSADDGSKQGPGFFLNTQSFTLKEVELLIKVLKSKFDLDCSANKQSKEQYRIYIKKDSMNKFKDLITPYFHKSMLYKLD